MSDPIQDVLRELNKMISSSAGGSGPADAPTARAAYDRGWYDALVEARRLVRTHVEAQPANPLTDKLSEAELDEVEAVMTGQRTDRELLIKKLEYIALAKLRIYATTSERRGTYDDADRLEDAMLLLTCVEKLQQPQPAQIGRPI